MRTLRTLGSAVAILAMLTGLAGTAVGQSEVGRFITGTMSCGDAGDRLMLESQAVQLDQWPSECTVTMADPRVSGVMDTDVHMACFLYDGDRACMLYGTSSLAGPDGNWVGTMGAMNDASDLGLPSWVTMQGTEAYEGWTFWSHHPNVLDESAEMSGILYQGPPPPWLPALPLAPASE